MNQESALSSAKSSSSSIGVIMNSWLTPTVLFVLLNLIIGFIAYNSSLATQKQSRNKPQSPSLLQRLLKSISHHQSQESQNPSHYFFQEDLHSQVHHIFSETHEINYLETPAHFVPNERDNAFDDFHLPHEEDLLLEGSIEDVGDRTSGVESAEQNHQETPTHLVFSDKDSTFGGLQRTQIEENANEVFSNHQVKDSNFAWTLSDLEAEEMQILEERRPKIVRERGSSKATEGDEEVDSKADDFIHRFKHQLKLQRLDSIVRYRDVPARGSSGGK